MIYLSVVISENQPSDIIMNKDMIGNNLCEAKLKPTLCAEADVPF